MVDGARCQRLTVRVAKGLLMEDPAAIDPLVRREAWQVARAVAELLSRRGPAWPLEGLGLAEGLVEELKRRKLAEHWVGPDGGSWLVLTQRSADLGRRVPSSDGGLRDSLVSRSVAIGRDDKPEVQPQKPPSVLPYARELASKGGGLFSRARWAS